MVKRQSRKAQRNLEREMFPNQGTEPARARPRRRRCIDIEPPTATPGDCWACGNCCWPARDPWTCPHCGVQYPVVS